MANSLNPDSHPMADIKPLFFRESKTISGWLTKVHPDDYQAAVYEFNRARTENHLYDLEYRFKRHDGSYIWMHDRGVMHFDPQGELLHVIGVFLDITERKQAEEALRDSEQRLRQLLEDRERLSQDLHDGILQSLYAVGLTLETSKLMGQKSPRQAVQQVDHSIRLLNTVIQEIRDFITGPRAQPMGGAQFKTTLTNLVHSLGHTGMLRFKVDVDAVAAKRLTDAQRLHLLNIAKEALSNSVRHSGGRQVFVSLRRREGSVRFEVKDDGVGFAVNTLRQSGLGLGNMRERTRTIGAQFKVLSKPGWGTRITVDIPRSGLLT